MRSFLSILFLALILSLSTAAASTEMSSGIQQTGSVPQQQDPTSAREDKLLEAKLEAKLFETVGTLLRGGATTHHRSLGGGSSSSSTGRRSLVQLQEWARNEQGNLYWWIWLIIGLSIGLCCLVCCCASACCLCD